MQMTGTDQRFIDINSRFKYRVAVWVWFRFWWLEGKSTKHMDDLPSYFGNRAGICTAGLIRGNGNRLRVVGEVQVTVGQEGGLDVRVR